MISITKRFHFCYAHQLPGYDGKCANLHGHNSVLEVEVSGYDGGYQGMVMDFGDLKRMVEDYVLDSLDHKMLNESLPVASPPTAENIVGWVAEQVGYGLPPGVQLESVRMSETEDSWATWRRG